jgi:hypothetical protein
MLPATRSQVYDHLNNKSQGAKGGHVTMRTSLYWTYNKTKLMKKS